MVEVVQKKNPTFAQLNSLIEAKYSMTAGEMHLVFSVLSMIKKDDKDFKEYWIKVQDLASLLGKSTKNVYKEIDNITDRLLSRVLYLKRGNESFLKSNWVASAEYEDGILKVQISPKLKPYLLNLKGRFKVFELMVLLNFRSSYSIRIYMLLKQYENIGVREFDLYDLREKLNINEKKYLEFKYFRKYVINQAQKEFNKKDAETELYFSDINFKLETIRERRKISRLRFIIIKQDCKYNQKILTQREGEAKEQETFKNTQTFKTLNLLGIREKLALELFEEHGESKIIEKIEILSEEQGRKEVPSPAGFIISALKDDYQSKKTVEKAKQKEVREKQAEEAKQKKIKSLTQDLDIEFGNMARENFLLSRTETQKAEIQLEIIKELEGTANEFFISTVKKDLGSRKIGAFLNKHIPNFEEDKQTYIQEQLKEKGLI